MTATVGRAGVGSRMSGLYRPWGWANYTGNTYGDGYAKIVEQTGLAKDTVKTCRSVAGSVELLLRNNDLSWNHHKVVAPLEPAQQAEWLEKAEANEWPVAELRRQVRRALLGAVGHDVQPRSAARNKP